MTLKEGRKAMNRKLKILGVGAVTAIISAAGVSFLAVATFILWKLSCANGYAAVLAFLIAVVGITGAVRIMYMIGACITNAEK